MSEATKADAIILQRGNYFLGLSIRDKDGNVTQKEPPRWEPDPNGSAVIVCGFNTEKNKTIGEADLFPWWESHGLDARVREKLALTRRNFPTPEELYRWIKAWDDRDLDLCEMCEGVCAGYDCSICPIEVIKAEMESAKNG